MQEPGYRSRIPIPYDPVIRYPYRQNFNTGVGDKNLFGMVNILCGDGLQGNRNALSGGDFQNRLAGDSGQDIFVDLRRYQGCIFHDKDIARGPLGDMSLPSIFSDGRVRG